MRVLIADDEHLVRFGLRSMIEELNLGLTVVAEAATGDDLLAQVLKTRPDLCFVDIRMPGLTGLAAMRKARKTGSRTRWVILSSHAEFEYAAEAIQLGASSYLLKPAGPAQLKEVLVPLIHEIELERRAASNLFEQSLVAALSAQGTSGSPPRMEAAWLVAVKLEAGALAARKEAAAFLPGWMSQFRAVSEGIADLVSAAWQDGPDLVCLAASWDPGRGEGSHAAAGLLDRLTALVKQSAGAELRATGFSAVGLGSWEQFRSALDRVKQALGRRFVLGTGTVHGLEVADRRMESLPAGVAEVCGSIEAYLAARERGQFPDLEVQAQAIREAFARASGANAALAAAARHLAFRVGLAPPPEGHSDRGTLAAWVEALAVSTREGRPEVRRNADLQVRIVEKVDQFLRQHLSSEVRVPEIASALGLTPNYLSSLYHKFTQATISERLTTLRLDQARDLLARPGSQVKEVASAVGYRSPRHFARLYLERFGHYPSGR